MKSIRTAAVRYSLTVAAAVAVLGSFAATSSFAGDLTRAEVKAQVLAAKADGTLGSIGPGYGYDDQGRLLLDTSRASRAAVKAATERALANGEIDAQLGESYGSAAPLASTGTSRAEVKALTARALRDGTVDSALGDAYGATATRSAGRTL